jgi:hypothetical protein
LFVLGSFTTPQQGATSEAGEEEKPPGP